LGNGLGETAECEIDELESRKMNIWTSSVSDSIKTKETKKKTNANKSLKDFNCSSDRPELADDSQGLRKVSVPAETACDTGNK
jgi:hypothetical protein